MRGRGGVSDDEMFDKGSEEDEFEADRRNASTSEQKRAQARHELEKRESKHACVDGIIMGEVLNTRISLTPRLIALF